MQKKAFTLIELVGVIIILGIIGAITFPVVNSTVKNSKQKSYDAQVELIIEASQKWGVKNVELLPEGDNTTKVYLKTLIQEGYLKNVSDRKLINPIDDTVMDGCVIIKYVSDYNQYTYEYKEDC